MKLKHSKLKNTGILFELLVRQMAADTLNDTDSKAIDIIKKYFNHSELAKEYKIYKAASTVSGLSESKGNMLISSIIDAQKKLNQSKLNREKYSLISAIKESYDIENFFKAKIDNYKLYASIYMLFESSNNAEVINPVSITDFKMTILEHITASNVDTKEKDRNHWRSFPILIKLLDYLIYKILVNKVQREV